MPFDLHLDRARSDRLLVRPLWTCRELQLIERDHFHIEQCGGCRKFRKIDTDWGWCRNHDLGVLRSPDVERDHRASRSTSRVSGNRMLLAFR